MTDILPGITDITPVYTRIVENAAEADASDIHFEPFEKYVDVRYRILGVIGPAERITHNEYAGIMNRIRFVSHIDFLARGVAADGRYSEIIAEKPYNIRVSIIPVLYGEKMELRILRKHTAFDIENIGLSETELEKARKIIHMTNGLVLVAGPTGSGKTTTLYSFIRELNDGHANITTVEDPIEYEIKGVNQSQVNLQTGFSFAAGLRSILRQDPDVIMIGEIRDEETAQTAVSAAIAGKLVFATIHTNDSVGSVSRLINMGVKPYLLSEALIAVFSQRLVNIIDKKSKVAIKRTAVYEIFTPTPTDRALIEKGTDLIELRENVANEGFIALNDKVRALYIHGHITFDDVIKTSGDDFISRDGSVSLF